MADPIVGVSLNNGTNGKQFGNWNDFGVSDSIVTLSTDLLDLNTGLGTGITLDMTTAFTNESGAAANATSGHGVFDQSFFDYYWYSGATSGVLTLTGALIVNGSTFTIDIAGHHGTSAGRDTNYQVTGSLTGGNYFYDTTDTTTPTAPTPITGTVVGSAITITMSDVDGLAILNGFTLEVVPASSGSIDSITSPITDGTTGNVFSTSGFGTITGAVLKDVATGNYSTDVFASLNTTGSGANTFDLDDFTANRLEGDAGTAHVNWDTASHTHVLEITDGTLTDTIAVVINPQSGWEVTEIASAVTTEGSYFFGWSGAPADGGQFLSPTSFNTGAGNPTAAGIFDAGANTSGIFWHQFHDVADNKLKAFLVSLGVPPSGGMNASLGKLLRRLH